MNDIVPVELQNMSLKDWQINATSITIGVMVLGRAWSAWRNGGGLMGIWRGFLYGTNTPKTAITTNTNENVTTTN